MHFLLNFSFSLETLALLNVLPFLYLGYQTRYWYRSDILARLDFLLQVALILIATVLFWKVVEDRNTLEAPRLLIMLHFACIALTVIIVNRASLEHYFFSKQQAKQSGKPKQKSSYKPKPNNKQVELVSWDDIVINNNLKHELLTVIDLLRSPKEADRYGIQAPKGILLAGPPGCGKTTIAKAMANTAGLSFFALKSDEVVSKWVGESEKNLSILFNAALKHAPSVIFIDEIDAIGRARTGQGQQWAENLLNHLLQLVDGVVQTKGLYVIGATNRADLVDPALKRSGRLNKVIEIPLPDLEARKALFSLNLSKLQLEYGVSIEELAQATRGATGADIKEICNQAGLHAFQREKIEGKRNYLVTRFDLDAAMTEFLSAINSNNQPHFELN